MWLLMSATQLCGSRRGDASSWLPREDLRRARSSAEEGEETGHATGDEPRRGDMRGFAAGREQRGGGGRRRDRHTAPQRQRRDKRAAGLLYVTGLSAAGHAHVEDVAGVVVADAGLAAQADAGRVSGTSSEEGSLRPAVVELKLLSAAHLMSCHEKMVGSSL